MVTHLLCGLRPIRRARRLTLIQMAQIIGVKPNSYSRFEAGDRRIYFDKAVLLSRRLGVKLDDLTATLDEQDALRLCDQRDKEAIAAGTFDRALWRPGAPHDSVPPPPSGPVPPPPQTHVPAPPQGDSDEIAAALSEGWSEPE